MRRIAVALLALATCLAVAAPARAADPGRWRLTGTTTLPIVYYQGVTVDPARNLFFDGVFVGLYRTDPAFRETGRNDDVIPPDVHAGEGYNHIGDISWDGAEGGRILLPLECYVPGGPNGGNPCLHGSIGVADPSTLQWRYDVRLDPAEIPKAMWNEVSPDGTLVWTSSGSDLLAYRTADITPANGAPGHAPIHSVRRLAGAVPPSGITGATFVDGRMLIAGQTGETFSVYSIDLATGERRLEIERQIVGESEGLVTRAGPTLGWLVQPFNTERKTPTYSPDHATLLSFRPTAGTGAPAGGDGAGLTPSIRFFKRSRRTVLRRRGFAAGVLCPLGCTARLTVTRGRTVLARTTKHARASSGAAARALVRLTPRGRRVLRSDPRRLRLRLRAVLRDPSGAVVRRSATARLR
jgi:hypothetical protein